MLVTMTAGLLLPYQLEYEVVGDALEEVDTLNECKEEVMGNAGTNGLGQRVERLLLLQPFRVCPELEAQVRHHLLPQPRRQLVPHREPPRRLYRVPLRSPINHMTISTKIHIIYT